ncbi:MAG: GOLPH3/VPS74 family protein [Armatimonadota bacterium]
MLTIPEQLTLLSYSERGGTQYSVFQIFNAAVAAASLVELSWSGRVRVGPQAVEVVNAEATGKAHLDRVLTAIGDSEPQPSSYWTRLSRSPLPDLRGTVRDALLSSGAMSESRGRKLLVLPSVRYLPKWGQWHGAAEQVRQTLLEPGTEEARRQVLAVLVDVSGLIYAYCDAASLSSARRQSEALQELLCVSPAADGSVALALQAALAARTEWNETGT